MNEVKVGYKTSEFWFAAISNLVIAVLALLVGYGTISGEQAELWRPVILGVAGIAMAIVTASYSNSRARVKSAVIISDVNR